MTLFISIAYLTLGILLKFVYKRNFEVYANYPKAPSVLRITTAFIMCGLFNLVWFAIMYILGISRYIGDIVTTSSIVVIGIICLLELNGSYRRYRDAIDRLESFLRKRR